MLKLRHCVAFKLDRRIGDLMFVNRPEAAYEGGVAGENERGHDDHRDFESRIAQIEQLQSLERGRHNYVALPCKQHKQIGGAYPRGIAYVEDCFAKVFAHVDYLEHVMRGYGGKYALEKVRHQKDEIRRGQREHVGLRGGQRFVPSENVLSMRLGELVFGAQEYCGQKVANHADDHEYEA